MPQVPPMATCPRDGTPLIMTAAFRGAEFYCLACGAKLGFMDPRPVPQTDELNELYDRLEAEWDEHVKGKLIVINGLRTEGCEQCAAHDWDNTHDKHASAEEWAEHERALEWLRRRADPKTAADVSDVAKSLRE